jgi:hypothetical protein
MKKLLIFIAFLVLASISINGFAQGQGKGNANKNNNKNINKGQGQNHNKGQDQVQGKGQGQGQGQGKGLGQDKDKVNQGKSDEHGNVIDRNPRGKDDVKKVISRHGNDNVFVWNRETFKDRGKIRNEGKVTVCHKFNNADEPPVTISISRNALNAHLNHGDVQGDCPAYTGKRTFSDIILGRRATYYNTIYGAQDQVVYSQSILDYALQRLTGARTQLVTLQSYNAPAYEIEQKQAVVLELENNVSLLETALAVTAGLLVAKLVD